MNTPLAIIIGAGLIAAAMVISTPHYTLIPIVGTANATSWKVNNLTGDVYICATPSGDQTQAGCSSKLTQF
ncbi:MAG: hypothetical protein K2Q01_09670 [Rickettsiales bacterium]|nr:hypothetical protein [Rickettsiales bacterium]